MQRPIEEFGMGEADFPSLSPALPFPLSFPLHPSFPSLLSLLLEEVGSLNPVRASGEGCKLP